MKTIKELENYIRLNEHGKGKLQALKDILELIDKFKKEIKELMDLLKPKGKDIPSKRPNVLLAKLNLLQELKARIKG